MNSNLKYYSFKILAYLFIFTLLFLHSCGTPYQPEDEKEQVEIPVTDSVPADATLETVTWNLEWYGSSFNGPPDKKLQTKNIVRVVDSLNADLFAFQEVNQQEDLNDIVENMKGYRGFVAEHVGQSQKMAVAFNTNTIDSLDSGAITKADIRQEYQQDWGYYWAGGRLPLFFSFTYTFEGTTQEFYAVIVHGKANTGNSSEREESYQRRKKAAEGLYYYLQDHKQNASIILLGDYNDDVDVSIYDDSSETPYYKFVNDTENFDVITKKLSNSGQSASVYYDDIIDHITISDELFDEYVQNSTAVYDAPLSYINDYGETTSDHLPVWSKLDVTVSKSIAAGE